MGGVISNGDVENDDTEGDDHSDEIEFENLEGFRIVEVLGSSPAARVGLRAYEEFIVAINNTLVGDLPQNIPFPDALAYTLHSPNNPNRNIQSEKQSGKKKRMNSEEHVIARNSRADKLEKIHGEHELVVWNCILLSERVVTIKLPAEGWRGPGVLGCGVKRGMLKGACEFALMVSNVKDGSSAQASGLAARDDWIVGTLHDGAFESADALEKAMKHANLSKGGTGELELLVYSLATGRVRVVEVWIGNGNEIGCEVADGLAYYLPDAAAAKAKAGASSSRYPKR